MTSKVSLCEVRGASRVQFKQLLHVEDLNSVVDGFRADDGIVTEDSDLSPVGADGVVLRKTTKVDQLALRVDLRECSAIVLANRNEFTTTVGSPAPARRSTSEVAAKIGVGKEVIKVDVAAPEGVVPVSRDGSNKPILARCVAYVGVSGLLAKDLDRFVLTKFRVLGAIHLTSRKLSLPLFLQDRSAEFCMSLCARFLPSSVP